MKNVISIIALIILLTAIVLQNYNRQQDLLNKLNEVLPGTTSFEKITGKHIVLKAYKTTNDKKELIGYGAIASSSGYGGPITEIVGIDVNGKIMDVAIMEHSETPWFLQRVIANDFLKNFRGKIVSEPFILGEDVDRVTGATYSSRGITNAIREAAHWVGVSQLGENIIEQSPTIITRKEIILLGLYALVFISIWKKKNTFRVISLVFAVIFLGFWQNSQITYANLTTLFSGNAPSFSENPFWYFLVLSVLVLTMFIGKNFYCYWMCPFGAIQEGLYKLSGFKYKPCPRQVMKAAQIRLPLAWGAFMIALLFHNPSIASYEPFSALFQFQGNKGQWLLMPLVLFIGVFVYRFWCRIFCPVGAVIDLAASVKKVVSNLWAREKKQ